MKVYIGIDAHTTNYTLATWVEGAEQAININTYSPAIGNIVNYCKGLRKQLGKDIEILTGYEAGALASSFTEI
ncbi:hypothetical protein [Anaerolactibacter massiliensis]|uniref:hypothetical protein n=1 Tax=Anaerolactibacter massiliensis TaxID=2044573 RepID=UPI000CFA6B3B|nr:hypothetical protein [Anaerolactibacter massiliensis]